MTGLGLPTLNAFLPVAASKKATVAPFGRAIRIQIGSDQFGAVANHLHCELQRLGRHRSAFTNDHVIGGMVHDGKSIAMQRVQQSSFADHEGCPARLLHGQKPCRGHRAREDMVFFRGDSHPPQLCRYVAPRPLAVIRQKQKRNVGCEQLLNKGIRTGNQLAAAINHAVHVNQKSAPHLVHAG
jgi:hypothetical protein